MISLRYTLVAAALSFTDINAMGESLAYTCEVTHVYDMTEYDALEISAGENIFKGSSFAVSRLTGEIIGATLPTLMAKSTRVINRGSTEYSFKSIADLDLNYQVIEIQEFRESAMKPFVSSSMGGAGIVTGLCK